MKTEFEIPKNLKACIEFHGHLCPGLVYGYLVAEQSIQLLNIKRSEDEEIVAICENDSCAIDALQVLLGTTAGKGNLILKDYGKNAYTVLNRATRKAYRFSRKKYYNYEGKDKEKFEILDKAIQKGKADEEDIEYYKMLKVKDLISKPFDEVFYTQKTEFTVPPFAQIVSSQACAKCGEMTMISKMVSDKQGGFLCIPCEKT